MRRGISCERESASSRNEGSNKLDIMHWYALYCVCFFSEVQMRLLDGVLGLRTATSAVRTVGVARELDDLIGR